MYKCHTYRIIRSQTNAACFGIDLKNSAFYWCCHCSCCCCCCCRRMCHIHTRSHTHIQIVNKIMLASAPKQQTKKKERRNWSKNFAFSFIVCRLVRVLCSVSFFFFLPCLWHVSMFLFRWRILRDVTFMRITCPAPSSILSPCHDSVTLCIGAGGRRAVKSCWQKWNFFSEYFSLLLLLLLFLKAYSKASPKFIASGERKAEAFPLTIFFCTVVCVSWTWTVEMLN